VTTKQFVKAQLWKQWNKFIDRPNDSMTDDERNIQRRALKCQEKDLHLDKEDTEEEDDDE
jgi:hypothetical protein